MRKNPRSLAPWPVLALLFIGAGPALAQNVYVTTDYMRVAPAKVQAYLDLEQKTWKPYHQALVAAGKRLSWALYAVASPAGTEAPYNYVTVAAYAKFADMENPYPADILAKVYPGKDVSTFGTQAEATRELVRSETWQALDRVQANDKPGPRRYAVVNFMKVSGNEGDYLAVEQKVWKPIHSARVSDGHAAGWGLYALRLPGGSGLPYNFATVDWYDNFADLENPVTNEMFKKAYPNLDDAALSILLNRTGAVRDLVRSEVWQLVDETTPAPR